MKKVISALTGVLLVLIALTGPKTAAQDVRRSLTSVARVLAGSGTVGAPSYSWTSSPTTGLYLFANNVPGMAISGVVRSAWGAATFLDSTYPLAWTSGAIGTSADTGLSRTAVGQVGFGNGTQGDVSGTFNAAAGIISSNLAMGTTGRIFWSSRAQIISPSDGSAVVENNAQTIGSQLKADALPTVSSGFGTSPSITAGSTPFAGSVNVGTGGVATTGVILFNGTAFPAAPFCVYSTTTTNAVTRGTPTTTQLTLNTTTAWTASDIVSWHCISSK